MTSLLFPDAPEAAFSMYNLLFTIGACFTFGISYYLCMSVKIYIYYGLLIMMAVFYAALEMQLRKEDLTSLSIEMD